MEEACEYRERIVTENIDAYMTDIKSFPRISHDREAELAAMIKSGNPEEARQAKEELITSNLRLVVKIAHDFKRFELGFADLVAEGNLGLITAADKFDPSKGPRFSCYAAWWIKQAIRKAIADTTKTIRVPRGSAQRVIRMQKETEQFVAEHGRRPTDEELSEITGFSMQTVEGLRAADIKTYYMDATVNDDSATTFAELTMQESDEEAVKKEEMDACTQDIVSYISSLPARARWIVEHAFGLGGRRLDFITMAQETGIPVQRLQQKLQGLLDQCRQHALSTETGATLFRACR